MWHMHCKSLLWGYLRVYCSYDMKPTFWLWMWTMPKNDQREVLSLDGSMGFYPCLAQVYFEGDLYSSFVIWKT